MTTTAPEATQGDEEASQALVQVQAAIATLKGESITFDSLLALIAPPPVLPTPPASVAPVPAITDAQRRALAHLLEVFGHVVPTTRRVLTTPEMASITDERVTLDEIEELAKKRKEGIRTTVCNHFDMKIEERAAEARAAGETFELPPRDEKGHYVQGDREGAPGAAKVFSRETRSGGINVDPEALRALANDPILHQALLDAAGVDFTHEDYLAMTRSVRVLDEAQVMLHLRKHPDLVHALKMATTAKPRTASLFMRKS